MRIPSLGIEIPCYVIEGERRVLVQRGMVESLGMARGSTSRGGDRLANFATGERIKPYIAKDLIPVITDPIQMVRSRPAQDPRSQRHRTANRQMTEQIYYIHQTFCLVSVAIASTMFAYVAIRRALWGPWRPRNS